MYFRLFVIASMLVLFVIVATAMAQRLTNNIVEQREQGTVSTEQ